MRKRYDLRFKDWPWRFRDALAGAQLTDTDEERRVKKLFNRNTFIGAAIAGVIALVCWIIALSNRM